MKNKKENLNKMTPEELAKELSSLREELRVLHFKSEGAKSKNVKEGKALRRQIARVLTKQNQNHKK